MRKNAWFVVRTCHAVLGTGGGGGEALVRSAAASGRVGGGGGRRRDWSVLSVDSTEGVWRGSTGMERRGGPVRLFTTMVGVRRA